MHFLLAFCYFCCLFSVRIAVFGAGVDGAAGAVFRDTRLFAIVQSIRISMSKYRLQKETTVSPIVFLQSCSVDYFGKTFNRTGQHRTASTSPNNELKGVR